MNLYSRLPRPVEWHIKRCKRLEALFLLLWAGTLVITVLSAILFSWVPFWLIPTMIVFAGCGVWAGHRVDEWNKILRWEALGDRRSTYRGTYRW